MAAKPAMGETVNTTGKHGWRLGLATLLLGICHPVLHAQPLCPPPAARAVLVLHTASGPATACDLQALDGLPQKTIETRLPDTLGMAGLNRWSGVALSHIARRLGAGPQAEIQLIALNNYAVSVPMSDLSRFDPVLASRRNGETISVRDKGPLILIYPFDQHRGELDAQEYLHRSIWQVHEIRIK